MRNWIWVVCGVWVWAVSAGADPLPRPVTDADYAPVDDALVSVGQLLFYDPILSGNREVSCATCHHPRFGTSDGLSLSLGDGARGLGPDRVADPDNLPEQHIPRNAPALFNLGARAFTVLFHDGRIEVDPTRPSGLRTPLEEEMVAGFDNLLSAQTMFPVLSADEMAGHYSENEISRAVRMGRLTGPDGAWDLIAARVRAIPAYRAAFGKDDIAFTDISNAVAAFMMVEWRSDDSPFDRHLRGEAPLTGLAAQGMDLFYGDAGCAACHSGPFQTDHGFHAMGVPQFGPGKAARFERHRRDLGRARVTGRAQDAYAFRTPTLRNVAQTAPYGHTGAYRDLATFVAAHAAPRAGLAQWSLAQARLPDLAGAAMDPVPEDMDAIAAALSQADRPLSEGDLAALVAFLEALSDPVALGGRLGIPARVPSGLPIDR